MDEDLTLGYSLAVQWLGLQALTAKGAGSIPGQRTKILQTMQPKKKKQKERKKILQNRYTNSQ